MPEMSQGLALNKQANVALREALPNLWTAIFAVYIGWTINA